MQNDIFSFNSNEGTLVVNPNRFLEAAKQDFKIYIKLLKKRINITDRNNFEIIWDSQKGI